MLLRMSTKSTIATLRYQMVLAMLDRFHQELLGPLYQPMEMGEAGPAGLDLPPRMWSLHPETMVWSRRADSADVLSGSTFRDILDEQRAYVWRARKTSPPDWLPIHTLI